MAMQTPSPEISYPENLEHVDALLVLGRGIDADGHLTESGRERVPVALAAARVLTPRVVVFSGGHSWVQERDGIDPPSEGGAMLRLAHQEMGQNGSLPDAAPIAEETSTSTVGNFINSKPLLDLQPGDKLGIVSDDLHFLHRRPQNIAHKVLPGVEVHPIVFPMRFSSHTERRHHEREEFLASVALRLVLLGVKPGDTDTIAHRQQRLYDMNIKLRPSGGASQAYAGS